MPARNGWAVGVAGVTGAVLVAVLAIACGGGGDAQPEGPGGGGGGGGEQASTPPPPELADDAGSMSSEMDAGVATPIDAGVIAIADAGSTAATDGAVVATDGDGGGPTPEERWRAMIRRGRSRFNSVCSTCHPGGNADIGPRIRGVGFSTSRMRRQIRSGSGRMRPIGPGRLSESAMEDLFAYLSTMGAVRGVQRPQ